MLEKCRDTVKSADKYLTDRKAQEFLRDNRLCPPPKGHWTMTFSKVFTIEDLPKSFFGPLQSVRLSYLLFLAKVVIHFTYLFIFLFTTESFLLTTL